MVESWIRTREVKGVGIVTINRPEILNAISPGLLDLLGRAVAAMTVPTSSVRCIVLTGEGRAFSAGADLSAGPAEDSGDERIGLTLERDYHPFLRLLRDSPIPIVTAVNGPAAGAGLSLAMMGDIITCARSAYFLQAFRNVGLVPDCGSTWLLPRVIGSARAREMSLLGGRLDAATALAWGLVNRVFPDDEFLEATIAVAARLADGPVEALGRTRRLFWDSERNSYEEQLDLEARAQRDALAGPEWREGTAAFREKRPPSFASLPSRHETGRARSA